VDAALAWLARAPDRFFLWVHFYDPHARYRPPPGFAAAFAERPYAGEIAYVDSQLGRLLAALDARFPASGTLLAVTSDHGESLGEHGERTHAYTLYDATQRVPLLLRGPRLPAGRVVSAQVRLVDVAPTLLALSGAEPFAEADGRDLLPLVDGDETAGREAYAETVATYLDHDWSPLFALRTAAFKYIRAPRPELYDLGSDPGERRNLAPDRPDAVVELDAELAARLGRPPAAVVSVAGLGAADRERLHALGYVAPEAAAEAPDFTRVTGPDPKDGLPVLAVLAAAQQDVEAGHLDAALARLSAVPGQGTAVLAQRAAIAVGAGRPDLAERDARAVLARQPGRSDLWLVLGRALAARGDLPGAAAALERALALEPGLQEAEQWLGRVRAAGTAPAGAAAAPTAPGDAAP
jgi:hypothetical protein